SIVGVSQDAPANSEDHRAMSTHQSFESAGVGFGHQPPHELTVRKVSHGLARRQPADVPRERVRPVPLHGSVLRFGLKSPYYSAAREQIGSKILDMLG